MKILIAEDDPVSCKMLESILRRWGYDVITTNNGNDALEELLSFNPPQLALLDWELPGIDGPEICSLVRKTITEPYIYIIMVTSKSEGKNIIDGMNSGADDYITKPYNPQELEVRLNAGRRIIVLQNAIVAARDDLKQALEELSTKNTILSNEIEAAGIVQDAIMLKIDSPDFLDYQICFKPHHSVGGDYFGMITVNPHQSILYCGDVSGKGVPAAMLTGFFKNEFAFAINKRKFSNLISPAEILKEVNASAINVCKATKLFSSAWCGLIDNKSKKIIYSSAGHDYPILINEKVETVKTTNGPIIGIFETFNYEDEIIDFTPPTKFFLYTDGLTDQEIGATIRFGRDRLMYKIEKFKHLSTDQICKSVIDEILRESKDFPQFDDMLAIVLSLKS